MFVWNSDYVFNTVRAYFYKAVRGDFGYWIKAGDRIITNSGNIEGFVKKSSKGETFIFKLHQVPSCRITEIIRHRTLGRDLLFFEYNGNA